MRKYDATARRAAAEQTRERICDAAEVLFLRDGYARTSIRAVAREAGVSDATVYLVFATKAALLDAVIIRATRTPAPPIVDLASFASAHAVLMERAAELIALGEAAALMDAELRPLRDRAHERLRAYLHETADRLELGAGAGDTLYAIATETTYLRRGLPPERYAEWLTGVLSAALLSDRSPSPRS